MYPGGMAMIAKQNLTTVPSVLAIQQVYAPQHQVSCACVRMHVFAYVSKTVCLIYLHACVHMSHIPHKLTPKPRDFIRSGHRQAMSSTCPCLRLDQP